ncbi:hypothetical protein [Micromonospora chokoriensis]|nr:hypothetical protein [Micromonospora chokoriensis]
MSGRTLGRLLGSFLVLTALAVVFAGDPWSGQMQTADVIWNMPAPR